MRKTLTIIALTGLLFGSYPASAGGNYENIRAWIAESMQWRLSYLPKVYQASDVISTADGSFQGAATLLRTRNGIEGSIMTFVDDAGAPYTLWIMVVNNTGACTATPCTFGDLMNPDIELSIYNGGGALSASDGGVNGVIKIDFETVAGPLPEGLFDLLGTGVGVQRGNGFSAEVWLIIDSHDPLIDASGSLVTDLTTTDGALFRNHRISIFTAVD